MKVLFLSSWNPCPPDVGARARALSLLKALGDCGRNEVDLVAFAESREEAERARAYLDTLAIRSTFAARAIEGATGGARFWRRLAAALRGVPYNAQVCRHVDVARAVRDRLCQQRYDVILAETSWMGQYVDPAAPGLKVLSWQNVDFEGFRKRAAGEPNPLVNLVHLYNHRMARRFELRLLERFDVLLTVTEADRRFLLATGPVRPAVHVLPLSVDTEAFTFQPPGDRPGAALLFVGAMFYQPNVDALTYFHREVYGTVRQRFPHVRLTVVGKRPRPAVRRLAGEDPSVHVTGTVPDLAPYYREAVVLVAPIRYGGGMKTKVLEAMAFGVPVVASPSAVEGIDARDGEHAFVRESADSFAEAVIRLLSDGVLRRRMAVAARRLVEERYSQQALAERLRSVLVAARDR